MSRPDKLGIVVHLVEIAPLAERNLAVAKTEVQRVFRTAGVAIIWTGRPIPISSSVAAQHGCPTHRCCFPYERAKSRVREE